MNAMPFWAAATHRFVLAFRTDQLEGIGQRDTVRRPYPCFNFAFAYGERIRKTCGDPHTLIAHRDELPKYPLSFLLARRPIRLPAGVLWKGRGLVSWWAYVVLAKDY